MRVKARLSRKASQAAAAVSEIGRGANHDHGRRGRPENAPARGDRERERNQQSELRLVDEEAEQHARERGRPVQEKHSAAEKGRGQESVLAVGEIDEGGGKGERGQKGARLAHDGKHVPQIKRKRRELPDGERREIGK